MGNEEDNIILQKNEFLNLEFKQEGHFENQLVEGQLLFYTKKDMKLDEISIEIRMLQTFKISESRNKIITNDIQKKIFSKKFNLPKIFKCNATKNIPIPPALHKIPFKIFLPKNIPPSFEYPRDNKKGYIRYIFTAEILTSEEKFVTEEYFIVKQRPFIFPPLTKFKVQDRRVVQTTNKVLRGESSISGYTPSRNIVINGPIKFEVDADNRHCDEDIIKFNAKLIRVVTFKKDGELYSYDTMIYSKKYSVKILKKEMKVFKYEDIILKDAELKDLTFNEKSNPYLGKITDLNLLMPSMETPIMKCEYKLELSSDFDSKVCEQNKPIVIVPIYGCHQSQIDCERDKLLIKTQIKNIPRDTGPYAPIYVFNDEGNNIQSNNNKNQNNNNNNNQKYNAQNNNIQNNNANNNIGNNNMKNNNNFSNDNNNRNNNNFAQIPGNSNFSMGQLPSDIGGEAYPITCNDFPTLASINREMKRRENNNFNNANYGQGGNNQNNQYNPYDNIFP
jgi:hypothetical protein